MPLFEILHNEVSTPMLGVPLTVLGTAAGGALASFAYGIPEATRMRLFFLAISNTFIGALGVAVLPVWLGWQWVTPVLLPPVAGLLAFVARWVIPLVVELAPQWIRNWIGSLGKTNPPQGGTA